MSIDLYARVRAVVQSIEDGGKPDFTLADVRIQLDGEVSDREIKAALNEIWKNEGGIYSAVIADTIWSFGYKPAPDFRRKPIGRRR